MLLTAWFVYSIICAAVAEGIVKRKNNDSTVLYAALGFFFGVFGIMAAAAATPGDLPAPKGMQAVRCIRCNAVTNIPEGAPMFECWQCKRAVPM
jgi:hypothetical protein